ALRHEDDALDAVQDAMLQLARAYADRPAQEWKPLFYRILENRIRDMQRRRTVRGRVIAWLPFRGDEDDEEPDPIAQAPSPEPQPPRRLELEQAVGALEKALGELPRRQQQAFLLRTLEGLDVAETAAAAALVVAVVLWHRQPAGEPAVLEAQHAEDMDLLADSEALELLDGWDGPFYEWATTQTDNVQSDG